MASGPGRGRRVFALICATLGSVAVGCALPRVAHAQIGSARYSSMVIDARSGAVLEAVNADELRHPASLTKLMTLYMLFEALRDRRLTLNQLVPVSYHAASQAPSKLGLTPRTRITVEEAILGLVTKSANDAASALGELLGGDEDRFGQMMTLRARALGMNRTIFHNASGLPDPEQVTTARDLAILARHLITDFPGYYGYFSTPNFVFHGRTIYNHDRMLQTYPGADGMKTGYTEASGHNLITSAERGGVRLVGVVLGAASNPERDYHMTALLDQSFEQLDVPGGRRGTMVASNRSPSLIASARAATVTMPTSTRQAPRAATVLPVTTRTPTSAATRWGIQVGTFSSEKAARQAATAAQHVADAGDAHVERTKLRGKPAWRAQLTGLTAREAQSACGGRARKKSACFIVRPEGGEMASR
jgi:D-alanyl-D-alanine carboxypeptidase